MINGAHVIIYSTDAEADREFFRDVLGLTHVDVGGGWLIFGLPPSEVAVHPAGGGMEEGEEAGESNGNGHSAGNGGEDEELEAGGEDEDLGEAEAESEEGTGLEADADEDVEEEIEDDGGGAAGEAAGGRHELYLMCDDIEVFVDQVGARSMECSPVQDQGWGLVTMVTLPGGGQLGVYQPRHARPPVVATGGGRSAGGGQRKSAAKKVARPAAKKKPAKKGRR